MSINFGMNEEGFELGAEVELLTNMCDIEWLDSDTIACQHQAAGRVRPDSNREHSPQLFEARGIPLHKGMKHGLGVAVGMKAVSRFLQLRPNVKMIVDFAVEDNDG